MAAASTRGTTRLLRIAVVVVAVLVLVVTGALAWSSRETPSHAPVATAAEVTAYQAALLPIVQEWGSVEVLGMQPAVSDLVSGKGVPPETIRGEAAAWRATFLTHRERLRALHTPAALSDATALFDRALARYLDAARLFGAATAQPLGKARLAVVDEGIAAARDGDRLYNEASMVLQQARTQAGLPKTTDFPDHPAGR